MRHILRMNWEAPPTRFLGRRTEPTRTLIVEIGPAKSPDPFSGASSFNSATISTSGAIRKLVLYVGCLAVSNGLLSMPRLIPVIDVLYGVVVRAVGGRRSRYRPLSSPLCPSAEPRAVADALRQAVGGDELYVADLDAIMSERSASTVGGLLADLNRRVLLDAAGRVPVPPPGREVLSVEARLSEDRYREHARTPRAVFSVDLFEGRLVEGWQRWGVDSAWAVGDLIRIAYGFGYRSFIVLDLASVGRGDGGRTDEVLRAARTAYPDVELIAGGGVRGRDDVARLGAAGADAVLVASALHDGALP